MLCYSDTSTLTVFTLVCWHRFLTVVYHFLLHTSLFVSFLVFLTLVFLSGDRCPVVVVLASVLQHGVVPQDIEEMLEVGRLQCNFKVPQIDFPSFLCN